MLVNQATCSPCRPIVRAFLVAGALLGILLSGCNSSSGSDSASQSGTPGALETKRDGSSFFVDGNQGGGANRIRLINILWGRLVDVHDVDDLTGKPKLLPQFRDMLINENVQTDSTSYRLEINSITQKTRLVVLCDRDVDEDKFIGLVRDATASLPPIAPKSDDGTSPEPFSFMARNATLALIFDDVLQDNAVAEGNLSNTVRVLTGYPPSQPFPSRTRFDPNYGALIGGSFHSTRILIDMTVSEQELADMSTTAPVNSLGLPSSLLTTDQPNVSVHIPSQTDLLSGQFLVLRGLGGGTMDQRENDPIRDDLATVDVVRAMRAGNTDDRNNGFQLDLEDPELLGGFPFAVLSVVDDPGGTSGFSFILTQSAFTTIICSLQPTPGDVISASGHFLEVRATAGPPDLNGIVTDVQVQLLSTTPLSDTNELLGEATYLSTLDSDLSLPAGCWVSFAPPPAEYPATDVPPSTQMLLRFTEPMDPERMQPFDSFEVFLDSSGVGVDPTLSTVVGAVQASADLSDFSFTPQLPLYNAHADSGNRYHLELGEVTDLAGNPLVVDLPDVDFTVDESIPTDASRSIVLRFDDIDEYKLTNALGTAEGKDDLRGQFFFDFERGIIRPRPVSRFPGVADRNTPVPGLMPPATLAIPSPLSPLGSKLQLVWRYADMGWLITDETTYNVDVEGISWSPRGGQVLADFFEKFEIRLSHSVQLPDEYLGSSPASGLFDRMSPYTANILGGASEQVVVHNRALGYEINPVDVFSTQLGTPMMPYPWNRVGGTSSSYTWRDTSNTNTGGAMGMGVPMEIEVKQPLMLYGDPADPSLDVGGFARAGAVPTVGLPLLMEFRCFPSDTGIGLNGFDVSSNLLGRPSFRAYSTGGIDGNGNRVIKDPDLELNPSGGFLPGTNQPTPLATDDAFYLGQLDLVIRVSRVHTVWLDSQSQNPDWVQPVLEPTSDQQPQGTQVICAFRGATTFNNNALNNDAVFNAQNIDPYGGPEFGSVTYFPSGSTGRDFKAAIDLVDGAPLIQVRFTFINNIETGLAPELSAIGIPYSIP